VHFKFTFSAYAVRRGLFTTTVPCLNLTRVTSWSIFQFTEYYVAVQSTPAVARLLVDTDPCTIRAFLNTIHSFSSITQPY